MGKNNRIADKDYRRTIDERLDKIFSEEKSENEELKKQYRSVIHKYDLVKQLEDIRKSKNLSQKQLAEIIGITQQEVSRFETNAHTPSLHTFLQIAEGLGCSLTIVPKTEGNSKL